MTIYMLDDDPKKTAEYLDDNSLNRMIRDIAQVLCNVHHRIGMDCVGALNVDSKWEDTQRFHKIPLKKTFLEAPGAWADWARKCDANYLYLVEHGFAIHKEFCYRFDDCQHKLLSTFAWAQVNVPDYGYVVSFTVTEIPLVMPKKYQVVYKYSSNLEEEIHWCYRNYYQAKVKQKHTTYMQNIHPFISGNQKILAWTRREKPEWLELS